MNYLKLAILFVTIPLVGLILTTIVRASDNHLQVENSSSINQYRQNYINKQNVNYQYFKTKSYYSSSSGADIRTIVLDEYFRRADSPLYGYGDVFVKACVEFGAPEDCITVAAIARNESDLCKYSISADMYNCWGFGGGGTYRRTFSSFQEGIYTVTDVLVNQYGEEYIIDPRLMEETFCGDEPGCADWGSDILYFMDEINNLSIQLGYGSLYDLRK